MNDNANIMAFLLGTAVAFWLHVARSETVTFWKITSILLALFALVLFLEQWAGA